MQPVIIVGAGPTGLALALALSRQGVPAQVLDSGDGSVSERPARTCVLPPDTAHWGRLPGAREESDSWRSWRTTYRGRTREELAFSPATAPLHLPLHALERALWGQAAKDSLVRITTGCRVTGIEQHPGGVTAYTTDTAGADGNGAQRHGSYLVGCDGARSTIRKLLEVAFPGRTTVERHAIATLRADLPNPGEAALHRGLPAARGQVIDEVLLRPLPDDRWRLDWPLGPDDDLVTPENLLDLIHRTLGAWHGGAVPAYDLLDTGVYLCHQRLARHWRRGRVFLAGDAAHLVGALGTHQTAEGLRDADNLAWKLAADWRHGNTHQLLNTYQSERRTAVGNRLRAVDQALPLVRGKPGVSTLVTGRRSGRLTLLADAALGRGALGTASIYDLPQPDGAVRVATLPGAPAEDVPVTALDGSRRQLRNLLGGAPLLILTAPGSGVWDAKHWLSAGLMPELARTVANLPLEAELVVAEDYPGAPAHTVLVVRPDGRLLTALPAADPGELHNCVQLLLGPAGGSTPPPAQRASD